MKKAVLVLTIVASLTSQALAVDKWLDTNGTGTADSGIANGATITWATGTSNWNTASSGSGGTISGWTSGTGDRAFFAAGADTVGRAYTVNLTAALTTGAVFVEEGTVTKTGSALTVQTIDITSGGFFINQSSALTVAAGGTTTLNGTGATYGNSNTGSGGSFFGNSTANANMQVILNGGGTLSANGGSTAITTILDGAGANKITGSGPLVIAGNGTLRIANTGGNNYTGDTIINGRLQISTVANVLPAGTDMTVNSGGEFNFQNSQSVNSVTGAGSLAGTGSNQLTITGSNSTVYSGVWSGGRINVNKSGGLLTLTNVNTSTGRFTMTNGAATVNLGASLGGDTMDLVVNGGTLTLKQAAEKVENLGGTGGSIVLDNGVLNLITDPLAAATAADNTYSGTISGAGGITKQNVLAGATVKTLILSGNNSYDGTTIISGGKIQANHVSALGSTVGNTQVASGAELLFDGVANNFTTAEPIQIAGGGAGDGGAIAVQNSANINFSGPITLSAAATLTTAGSATATYSKANAITGTDTNLTLAGGSGAGGGSTVSGAISLGTGSITKLNAGTWVLSNAAGNTYSGGTAASAGALTVTNTSGSGTGSGNITVGTAGTGTAGTLNIGNGGTGGSVAGDISFVNTSGTSNVVFNRSTDLTYGGVISGSNGNVTKAGAGTLTLTSANTYTGSTIINGGKVYANNGSGSATGTGAVAVNNGGTLGGIGAVSGAVSVNAGGTLSPGTSIESLDVGALTFDDTGTNPIFAYEINTTLVTADVVNAASLTLNGLTDLAITDETPSSNIAGAKFTLIAYGTLSGLGLFSYNGVALNQGDYFSLGANDWQINYGDNTPGGNGGSGAGYVTILTAVPEASSILFGGLACVVAAVGAVASRRRRRASQAG